MAHPRVLAWQSHFEDDTHCLDDEFGYEMDNEEAMLNYYGN